MSEDQEWSRRVLRAGYELVYEPEAAVHHSHRYSIADAFRRFFDSGVSAERSYAAGRAAPVRCAEPEPGTRVARSSGSGGPGSGAGSRTPPSTSSRSSPGCSSAGATGACRCAEAPVQRALVHWD